MQVPCSCINWLRSWSLLVTTTASAQEADGVWSQEMERLPMEFMSRFGCEHVIGYLAMDFLIHLACHIFILSLFGLMWCNKHRMYASTMQRLGVIYLPFSNSWMILEYMLNILDSAHTQSALQTITSMIYFVNSRLVHVHPTMYPPTDNARQISCISTETSNAWLVLC
jgi:hypothetical protein